VGDGKKPPDLEDIHRNWNDIHELSGVREYGDVTSSLNPMLEAFNPDKEKVEKGSSKTTVKTIFDKMTDMFQEGAAEGINVVFQYIISGPGGGKWYSVIKNQTCTIQEGTHETPTTIIKMNAEDFISLMSGSLNLMTAYTSGKLKIEGDIMKSQLIDKLFKF